MLITAFAAVVTAVLFAYLGPDRTWFASIAVGVIGAACGTALYFGTKHDAEGQPDAPNMYWALPDIAIRTVLGCFAVMFPVLWEWFGTVGYVPVLVFSAIVGLLAWVAGSHLMRKHADGLRLVFIPIVLVQLAAYAAYHLQVGTYRMDGAKPILWTVAIVAVACFAGYMVRASVTEETDKPGIDVAA